MVKSPEKNRVSPPVMALTEAAPDGKIIYKMTRGAYEHKKPPADAKKDPTFAVRALVHGRNQLRVDRCLAAG